VLKLVQALENMTKNTRSLQASHAGLQLVREAFLIRCWTQEGLAVRMDCSRHTVSKFLGGKPIDKQNFRLACQELGLSWQTIAGLDTIDNLPESSVALNELVQTIREKVRKDIQLRCGKVRVLDMNQPIESSAIYTDVNILEKISGRSRQEFTEILMALSQDFDRLGLGKIKEPRVKGLEAIDCYNKLMILGKPGAGKTTFVKRLAMLCCNGTFREQQVPIFITLKEFSETSDSLSILQYVNQQWSSCGITENAQILLSAGGALVLLDGLDEVRDIDHDRVLIEIKKFVREYQDCQIVITCRIAALEYVFEDFTDVEIADFNAEQIAEFINKWFTIRGNLRKAEQMISMLKVQKPIEELATNPLLLTLLCLIFEEDIDFPNNRSELYKECLDILLKKWDKQRFIYRNQVCKNLSAQRKKDMLCWLAFNTFNRGEYFFKKSTVERHIFNYIRNLPGVSDQELQMDSEAILKSIESQHGLLIERSRNIYSFSHLIFHEYLTAKYCADHFINDFSGLLVHLTNKFWREVFLLTVEIVDDAEQLLIAMKAKIDEMSLHDNQVQQYDYANQLLLDCYNSDFCISQKAIKEISEV
jgi:predicted NACHT family NTPase